MIERPTEPDSYDLRKRHFIPDAYLAMTRETWREEWPNGQTPWPMDVDAWIGGAHKSYLCISGSAGSGKTHIAVAVLRQYLSYVAPWGRFAGMDAGRRTGGRFVHAAEVEQDFRTSQRPLIESLIKHPFVLVDDVAWDGNPRDLNIGGMALLIHRMGSFGRNLVFTTNLDAKHIQALDSRVHSRLDSGAIVYLDGYADRRILVDRV
jgi:chromosomal replication initiation ATPase DnaA